ncbi:hypothetical protein AVEN_264248-1 [Araneus ventricosus]|uniref:DUF19 domain-containing protein n=1 Tax=Araneus ventricosus TaxID=182803 RepID=A0A4Y2R005_ARAVE|nr:hypothetical protein AVEN_264248-1 [Araneus ventricosus]
MWAALLIAFAVTGGKVESTSEECDIKLGDCHGMYPEEKMEAADKAPNEEELENLCPDLVKMADCFDEYIKECTDLSNFPLFPFYNRDGKLYKEICDKNSVLRSKYLANVGCYKRIENTSVYSSCYSEAAKLYEQYVLSKGASEREPVVFGHCKRMPYVLGCEAAEVQRSCGDVATETFIEVERLKDSTNEVKFCLHDSEQRNEIYNDFLPYIQIPENIRRHINKVLDALKEEALIDSD